MATASASRVDDIDDTPLTRRFLLGRGRGSLSIEERRAIEQSMGQIREFPARSQIIRSGERIETSTFLIEGYVCRYMDDRDGHRQLVAMHVPGDFVDLHAFPMKRLDHDIASLGPVKVGQYDHKVLSGLTERMPHLTRKLWFSTLLDAAMHREWIFRLGRLGAEGRIAHFFCELFVRLKMVGLVDGSRFPLPMTQLDLGEACGLTGVHVNRTLRTLREDGLLSFRAGEVDILDFTRLARRGEFVDGYLYPDGAGDDAQS
ncbi:MAG TPA: Crp/Fnr family transcriptional regulator [Sphingomonas sp.]|jgi:CRP-like cAMP-binding protein|nr:Crp/Fnr family transcriptional regulator [Sphingomonas sp.]